MKKALCVMFTALLVLLLSFSYVDANKLTTGISDILPDREYQGHEISFAPQNDEGKTDECEIDDEDGCGLNDEYAVTVYHDPDGRYKVAGYPSDIMYSPKEVNEFVYHLFGNKVAQFPVEVDDVRLEFDTD